ncbi:hypothetical protein [Sorangium sp. So ce854]|uniref:hypothetical protein n=1 Tax=Sorangium sp. So ce854 TaxID=3133322 RepID=UPI003F6158D8
MSDPTYAALVPQLSVALQGAILDLYGPALGITRELRARVDAGTATPEELTTYTQNADQVIDKVKTDMRSTPLDSYSKDQIDIITLANAIHYAIFQSRDEPFAKIVPAAEVAKVLKQNEAPRFFGFTASVRYSADLAPDQMVSQFGLDYTTTDNEGNTSAPYLVNGKPQPFVYVMESPMTDEIRRAAKIPFDPRTLGGIEAAAADPGRSDLVRQAARLVSQPDVACVIVRKDAPDDPQDQLAEPYRQRGYTVKKSADAPYTGNAMPQFGKGLDGKTVFSDLVQEMNIDTSKGPALGGEGTAIYLVVPKEGSANTGDPTLPRGSDRVKITGFDGHRWERPVAREQLDRRMEQLLGGFSDADRAELAKRLVTHDTLEAAYTAGEAKELPGAPLRPQAKKGIQDHEARVKRHIVAQRLGHVVAALRLSDTDKKKQQKKKKRAAGDSDRPAPPRKRASSGD